MSTEAITKTRFSRLRSMHSMNAEAENIAKKAAEKIAAPEPIEQKLAVAAFQSSI